MSDLDKVDRYSFNDDELNRLIEGDTQSKLKRINTTIEKRNKQALFLIPATIVLSILALLFLGWQFALGVIILVFLYSCIYSDVITKKLEKKTGLDINELNFIIRMKDLAKRKKI